MVCIYTAFFLYYTAPDKKEYMMLLLDTLLNQYLKATMAASLLMDRRVQINCASIIILFSVLLCNYPGTGKSYTIEGGSTEEARGVIPRASEDIFDCIPSKHLYCLCMKGSVHWYLTPIV